MSKEWNTNKARAVAAQMLRDEITKQMHAAGFVFRFAIGRNRNEICVRLESNVPTHMVQPVIDTAYRIVREKLQNGVIE